MTEVCRKLRAASCAASCSIGTSTSKGTGTGTGTSESAQRMLLRAFDPCGSLWMGLSLMRVPHSVHSRTIALMPPLMRAMPHQGHTMTAHMRSMAARMRPIPAIIRAVPSHMIVALCHATLL